MDFDPRRIPIIGHDIYQVGQVYRITAQACSPDPWIAVQAAWTYTPSLLWSLFKPDWGDMSFQRGGRRHSRKRFGRLRLDGAQHAPAPTRPGVAMALFTGYQLAERIGWYLVVADALTDFAVNWTSMAYQWSGCRVPGLPWARATGAVGLVGGSGGPWATGWKGASGESAHAGYATDSTVAIWDNGPKTCMISATIRMTEHHGHPGALTSATLIRRPTGRPTVRIPISGGGAGTVRIQGTDSIADATYPGCSWQVRLEFAGGKAEYLGGVLSASGSPAGQEALLHDP